MKKILTTILAAALGLSSWGVTVTTQEELTTAVANAAAGDTVQITAAGTYTLGNISQNITITGTVDGVVFDYSSKGQGSFGKVANGCTFGSIDFKFKTVNFHGWQESGKIICNSCTFNGLFNSYGDMVFNNCGFYQSASGGDYNMWVYGAGTVEYYDCAFTNTVKGKFLNLYQEALEKHVVIVKGCSFVNQGSSSKAAINVKASCEGNVNTALNYTVVVSDCTTYGPFPAVTENYDNSTECAVLSSVVQVDDRKLAKYASEVSVVEGSGIEIEDGKIVNASSLTVAYQDAAVADSALETAVIAEGSVLTSTGTTDAAGRTVYTVAPPSPVAQIGDKTYASLAAAVAAVENGQTIVLLEDLDGTGTTITLPTGVSGVTIKGADVETPVVITDLSGMAKTNSGLTFENIEFRKTGSMTLTMRGSHITFNHCKFDTTVSGGDMTTIADAADNFTFSYCDFTGYSYGSGYLIRNPSVTNLTIDHCSFSNCWAAVYYGYLYGDIRVVDSTISAWAYLIHSGNGSGSGTRYYFENDTLCGWFSYGEEVEQAEFKGCQFTYDSRAYACYVKPYRNTTFDDCSFESGVKVETQRSVENTFKECTLLENAESTLITAANFEKINNSDSAGIVIAPVAVVNETLYYGNIESPDLAEAVAAAKNVGSSGGIFYVDPSAYVADGYAAPKVGDVWKVGKVTAGELAKQAGATDTTATYSVPVKVVDAGGNELATYAAHDVTVAVAEEDIAGTKLTSVNLDDVVANAVSSAGADAQQVSKVEILVDAQVLEQGAQSISYTVKPEAIVTVGTDAEATTSTNELANADLAEGATFAFDLDVTATGVAAGGWVKVTHVSAGYPNEEALYKAKAGGGGVVVTVTTTHFSTFTATPGDPEGTDASLLPSVTNSVASANLFGALTVGGTAKPAYVAVPFGAFGDGDAAIAAADVVQAAALSNGDKMYVWNGAAGGQQKYEVYTVSGGAWTKAKKVTVAADGKQTEGSDFSPDAFPVASGKGVFIERADTSKPLYVYGQVLTNAVAETTFEAGLTLVSAPSTKAMGEIDLNALTWSGVTALPTRTARGKEYPDWSKIGEADYIYFRNAAGSTVKCYYSNGKWVTENGSTVVKVPAGTAFWYSGKAAGAKVKWVTQG